MCIAKSYGMDMNHLVLYWLKQAYTYIVYRQFMQNHFLILNEPINNSLIVVVYKHVPL